MIQLTPNYYCKFKCIADKCRHNCCIGWEIDIDEDTAKRYCCEKSLFGERLRQNIEGNPPHFVLKAGDRCPFLNDNNLCDIITELGEDALCEICTLHPRYRNFYSEFCETGLGLCCEEAARIILTFDKKADFSLAENAVVAEEEKAFFEERHRMLDILQNRNESIFFRFERFAETYGVPFDFSLADTVDTYLSLERLDEAWTQELEKLKNFNFDVKFFETPSFAIAFEQLSVYFVCRHMSDALYYGDYSERVRFVLSGCFLLGALWSCNNCIAGDEKMIDLARMYSSEIEYSEENTETLMYI